MSTGATTTVNWQRKNKTDVKIEIMMMMAHLVEQIEEVHFEPWKHVPTRVCLPNCCVSGTGLLSSAHGLLIKPWAPMIPLLIDLKSDDFVLIYRGKIKLDVFISRTWAKGIPEMHKSPCSEMSSWR